MFPKKIVSLTSELFSQQREGRILIRTPKFQKIKSIPDLRVIVDWPLTPATAPPPPANELINPDGVSAREELSLVPLCKRRLNDGLPLSPEETAVRNQFTLSVDTNLVVSNHRKTSSLHELVRKTESIFEYHSVIHCTIEMDNDVEPYNINQWLLHNFNQSYMK